MIAHIILLVKRLNCLSFRIFNNKKGTTILMVTQDKDIVNKSILDEFRMIMKFHDTDNLNEIDNQDMKFFYQSIKYTAKPIPSGVVAIAVTDIKHVENAVEKHEVLVARSLTNSDFDPIKIGQINQNKNGTSTCGTEVALLLLNNFDKQYGLVKSAFAVYNKPIKKFAIDARNMLHNRI